MTREDDLIKKLERGDADAFDALIELYYPAILRYCYWHAPNRSLAEDAAQETFLKAVRCMGSYVHRGKWKAYLYQIAANTCIDMRRKRWLTDIPVGEAENEAAYADTGFDRVHSDDAFRQMVNALPEEQRELIILRFSEDLTMPEISVIVDLPMRTVQSRLRSALKTLKKGLTEGDAL